MSTQQASRSVREGGLEGHQGGAGREREQSIDESKRGEVTLRVWLVGGAKRAGHSSWRYERHDTKQRARTHTLVYARTHTHIHTRGQAQEGLLCAGRASALALESDAIMRRTTSRCHWRTRECACASRYSKRV